jgi:hypothetical protein
VAALSGCGGEEPVTDEVRGAVEDFGRASADKDYQRLCDEILAPQLIESVERVGLPCEQALRQGLGDVRAPKVEVRSVVVNRDKALVQVRSSAAGQQPSQDTLEVVRQDGRWRISSLARAQPAQPPAAP